jgi:serine/threonine protein kinase/ABC-type oligopeptide transport system substrate-binding subunit
VADDSHQDPRLAHPLGDGLDDPTLIEPDEGASASIRADVGDKFEILAVIGAGGMGAVYKVRHRQLDHLRAVKVLTGQADHELIERLRREASITTGLTHPNIVTVYDLETLENGDLAVVMEYLQGQDLSHHVADHGPMSLDEVVRAFTPVADALDQMHGEGVVHRDIKPANLFVCDDGPVKILDFGVSRLADADSDLTHTGRLIGTPRYMAPELFVGEQASAGTDLYSLGAMLYFALTGRPPFEGSSRTELISNILTSEPERPDVVVPGLPAHAANAITRALAREPGDRWDSATAMLEAMQAEDTVAYVAPETRQRRRRRWRDVALGVLGLLAVVLLGTQVIPRLVHRTSSPTAVEDDLAVTSPPAAPGPVTGGTLRMGLPMQIASLDPMVTSMESHAWLHFLLYDPLLEVDWTGELIPALALRWEVHDDATRFVFHLRDDAVFHPDPVLPGPDHTLDAMDVQRSLERIFRWLDEHEDSSWRMLPPLAGMHAFLAGETAHPAGLRVIDDHVLEAVFERPAPTFLHSLCWPEWSMMAAEVVEQHGSGDLGFHVVGTGPFRLDAGHESRATLVGHDGAWQRDGDGRQLPYLDAVEVHTFRSADQVSAALRESRVDLVYRAPGATVEGAFDVHVVPPLPRPGWEGFQLAGYLDEAHRLLRLLVLDHTSDHPYVHDERIRRAIARALHRADLTEPPFLPADSPLVDSMLGYEPRLVSDDDGDEARRLLAEAGFPLGRDLPRLSFCTDGGSTERSERIVQQLADVGIATKHSQVSFDVWRQFLMEGGCDMLVALYGDTVVDDDPTDLLLGLSAKARLAERHPEADEIADQLRSTSDRATRQELVGPLAQLLVDDAMLVYLAHRSPERPLYHCIAGPSVRGITDEATGWMNPRRQRMRMLWLEPGGDP